MRQGDPASSRGSNKFDARTTQAAQHFHNSSPAQHFDDTPEDDSSPADDPTQLLPAGLDYELRTNDLPRPLQGQHSQRRGAAFVQLQLRPFDHDAIPLRNHSIMPDLGVRIPILLNSCVGSRSGCIVPGCKTPAV
jgi:hypothetical protein